ncbi:MAG: bifunctional diguanylate cyclase/phosphodiesterase [Saccharospirillum sp.]
MDARQILTDPTAIQASRITQYHQLMLDLSLSFINLPVQRMNQATQQALARMGAFFEADRAYVFDYDFTRKTSSNTHEWCAPGIEPAIDALQSLPLEAVPDWVDAHKAGKPLLVVDADQLPDGRLREILEPQGIKSLLTAPLMDGERCLGFVGFDSVRRERLFSEGEYDLLTLFANLLVSINQRQETLDQLNAAKANLELANQRFLNMLDGTNAAVYVADMDTHEVLFVNQYSRDLLGDIVGQTCWRSIQQKTDGPCDFCTNPRLLKADGTPAKPVTWEHFNPQLKRWYHITDQAIPWENGQYVRMEIALDITERKAAEQAMRESELRYRRLFDNSRDALMIVQPPDWQLVTCNAATLQLFGYEDEASVRQASIAMLSPDRQPDGRDSATAAAEHLNRAMHKGTDFFEWQHLHRDGHTIECSVLLNRAEWSGKTVVQGTVRDISPRKTAERALKQRTEELTRANRELEQLATVFTHANEGIIITDPKGTIIQVNDALCSMSGYGRDALIGENPRLLQSGRHSPEFYRYMWRQLLAEGHWSGEVWNQTQNGAPYAVNLTISCVRDEAGEVLHYVALATDITEQLTHQQQLERIAHYDSITQLPNRILLARELKQAMSRALRRNDRIAIAYLDLDGFKAINDQYGHDMGDQLLARIAQNMKAALRTEDILARLGGDEFVVVFTVTDDEPVLQTVLDRLLDAAAKPVNVSGYTLTVSASLGVTLYPQTEAQDADQLMRQADQAMYQAKLSGKNRYKVFDTQHHQAIVGHHERISQFEQALQTQALVLHYQPKVNMRTGEVTGVEALVRWQHPVRGLLPPSEFLPAIHNHPLSMALDTWVLGEALAQVHRWQQDSDHSLPVSINLSAMMLQQGQLLSTLNQQLSKWPACAGNLLEIEILESSALDDINSVIDVMGACHTMGVRFALDDFGVGYSSLSYLKRLPAGTLKIDQSFIRDMLEDADDLAILKGILGLARAFDREVIAEGVETAAHGECLLDLGCDHAQGYGIARPMPADAIIPWLERWQAPASWLHRPRRHDS